MPRRFYWSIFLLLPATGSFFSGYISGWFGGQLAQFIGVGVFAVCFFLMPLPLALFIAVMTSRRAWIRAVTFLVNLALIVLLIWASGPQAKAYNIGRAHRFARDFPIPRVRETGLELLRKFDAGTLRRALPPEAARTRSPEHQVFVDEVELPEDLRGKFIYVVIKEPVTVYFALTHGSGILIAPEGRQPGLEVCPIQAGVYAYTVAR